MITLSVVIDNYWSASSSPRTVQRSFTQYIHRQESDFDTLSSNRALLEGLARHQFDETRLQALVQKPYYLYLFEPDGFQQFRLLFWSTQVVVPGNELLQLPGTTGFVLLENGYYVWRKYTAPPYTAIALIPVKWNYSITNEYLQNDFAIGRGIEKGFGLQLTPGANPVYARDGTFLFSLQAQNSSGIEHNNVAAALLRLLAAVLLFLYLQVLASRLVLRNFYTGVLLLAGTILLLRVASYFLPLPVNLRQFELFDPRIYAANAVSRSLGDVLINALLFLWIVLFVRHYMQVKNIHIRTRRPLLKWSFVMLGILMLVGAVLVGGNQVRSLVADSQISFDVVNFFTLNQYSVAGFLVLGGLSIGFFLFSQIIIYLLQPLLPRQISTLILLVTIAGLLLLTLRINHPGVIFELCLLIWLLAYLLLLNTRQLYLFAANIVTSRLIFWLFFFSISITSVIIIENARKEIGRRQQYAEALSTKADPSSERLMNTVLTDFRSEALAPLFARFQDEKDNRKIKDSLLNENFTGYLNKYETRIYTFDASERPLYNEDSTTFTTLTTILRTQGKPTAVPDLYFYDVSYDRFTYISRKEITDSAGSLLGHLFILASPRQYKTDALYPELFLKGYRASIENSPIYSFAVYNKLQLVTSHNDYAFPSQLSPQQLPAAEFENRTRLGYDELWYKPAPDKVVIIAKKEGIFIESITLFSYLFCAFLFLTGTFWLLNTLIRARLRWTSVRQYWQVSIRNQVHVTVIFMSLLSFIVVGVATILFFIDRYNKNNRESLSRTIRVMQNEVRNSLSDIMVFDDVLRIYDLAYRDKLEATITRIAEVHAVDINLYDLDGELKVSSLPLPYNKGIVSNRMDPEAYHHLHTLHEIQFFRDENIGKLKYLSNYVPVLDGRGQQYAYLNIPYFTSQTKLRQEISNFLVAIINLNAFIFLIAGVVALFITNRITRSFTFISNRMKQVNLGKINEAIRWKRKDEIGELVEEYNKMVSKLDESALALAKSEREGAWREMARQVAHEIKNPLTPMKLSLQYLQKAIDSNSGNVHELARSVARTLVEQIDHLSQIAGEFSQFANIGNPRNETFDLVETLNLVTHLHGAEEKVQIHWNGPADRIWIQADKTHINRLFTNLLQNAIQAVPPERIPEIYVDASVQEGRVLVTVQDNGSGIPEAMIPRIFTPNFTTKTSGTGLGLAMCKGIVEQNHGRIWFETTEGSGTCFFVELPVTQAPAGL